MKLPFVSRAEYEIVKEQKDTLLRNQSSQLVILHEYEEQIQNLLLEVETLNCRIEAADETRDNLLKESSDQKQTVMDLTDTIEASTDEINRLKAELYKIQEKDATLRALLEHTSPVDHFVAVAALKALLTHGKGTLTKEEREFAMNHEIVVEEKESGDWIVSIAER